MAIDFRTLEAGIAALPSEKARGDAFERAVAHLLRRDPELGMRRVWGWRDWPGRDAVGAGRDLGIDLVADPEGDLFAVIPNTRGHTLLREIRIVADHTAYHVGEFAILRQVMGTWPPNRQG